MTPCLFRSPLALSVLLLPCLAPAQGVGRPSAEAIRTFLEQNPNRTVRFEPGGVVVYGPAIWSKGQPIETIGEARTHATGALRKHADLLGLGARKDGILIEELGIKLRQVSFLNYAQVHRGVPVQDGRVDVRVHQDGGISLMRSALIQIPDGFGVRPVIDAKAAIAIAIKHKAAKKIVGAPRLIIWTRGAEGTPPRLSWEIAIDEPAVTVWVDALNGKVLAVHDDVVNCSFPGCRYKAHRGSSRLPEPDSAAVRRAAATAVRNKAKTRAGTKTRPKTRPKAPPQPSPRVYGLVGTVMAWTNTGLRPTDALKNVPVANVQVKVAGVLGTYYTDAKGKFSISVSGNGPYSVTVDMSGKHVRAVNPIQGSPVRRTVQVMPTRPVTIQFLSAKAPEFDSSQTTAYWGANRINEYVRGIIVPNPSNLDTVSRVTANVNYNLTCNAFYLRNTINFFARGNNCNMTAFSTMIYHEWGHAVDDAFGGFSQTHGLSEGWGDILGTYATGQPVIGAGFRTAGGAIRTALNTRQYPQGSSVHQQGESWMGFAWDVRSNLIKSKGAAAGTKIAEKIVIGSIVADATDQPGAVREVFVLDDDDSNLNNGTPHYDDISAAARKRSLPFPERKLGSITHTALLSTPQQLSSRLVKAIVVATTGSFRKVEVVYDDGSSTRRREMVRSGNGNEMIALLPGQLSATSMSYHFEAFHSSNYVVRFPETGEIGYSTGKEEVLFVDDMENLNSTDWTHGTLISSAQDDWHHLAPTGKSGIDQGVAWRDPNKAFSGNYCRGNDLGPSGYNGSYKGDVHNFLRLKTLNLSGRTGVTLSYQRWLSVEGNRFDQGQILVNGKLVWQNPSNNLTETAWSLQTVRLTAADNNPKMALEYRLKSDSGLNLGGWAIDDVKLVSFSKQPPPAFQLTVDPPQVHLGKSTIVSLKGTKGAPVFIITATAPGPTKIAGFPILSVGGTTLLLPAVLDANGELKFNASAPATSSSSGTLLYMQAIEQSNGSTVTASNPMTVLFAR